MQIVGICRFSLLGRGDWKVYQGKPDSDIEEIAKQQAEKIFAPERVERRLATFEHLTLASLRGQTDQDFVFLVAASEMMPQVYKDRLVEICAAVPQVVVRFFPLIHIAGAQAQMFAEIGLAYKDALQFRLDDDDAICAEFIRRKRLTVERLVPGAFPVAVSFRSVMFASQGGPHAGVYNWPTSFLGAGVALWHPRTTIFGFGHFALERRFTSIQIPDGMALVTHSGLNDTQFDAARIKRQRMRLMDDDLVTKSCAKHFPFLSATARSIAGLPVSVSD